MDASQSAGYQSIAIVGAVSVEKINGVPDDAFFQGLLILGPTGAGKSTFIEALANDSSLRISSGQLEGFTQAITTYRVKNVAYKDDPIYVIDVPGFADTKISEKSIVDMVKKWVDSTGTSSVGRILYLTAINAVRLPGSHRQVLKTFQSLTGVSTASNITIVSTMWDSIWGDSAMTRAKTNFIQLQDDIWKDYVDQGSRIVKFHNTQESALSILDAAMGSFCQTYFHLETFVDKSQHLRDTPFGDDLYNNLQIRLQNLRIERSNVQSAMEGVSARSDQDLMDVLRKQLGEVERCIENFERDVCDFDLPAAASSALPTNPTGRQSPNLKSHNEGNDNSGGLSVRAPQDVARGNQGRFAKVMSLVKCWGKSVGERHDD